MKTTSRLAAATVSALLCYSPALFSQQASTPSAGPNATAPANNSETIAPAPADSKIRIVRLSQVEGQVQLDRNVGHGFEGALTNLPIVEGSRLQTADGMAEVEFEDNSTVRIAPDTLVEFPRLVLHPTGVKASTVKVLHGTVYVSLIDDKQNEFTLAFGQEELPLPAAAHVRLQVAADKATLAVMGGSVPVSGSAGTETATKKKTVTFDLNNQSEPTIAKNVAETDYDAWDNQAADYHKQYANAVTSSPYAFGTADMNYYGSFVSAAGCGSMWRPYFASAVWDPYANGTWALYPGVGYSWVSPYPWGWTPYHFGSWSYCPSLGWGWLPGGSWIGLGNAPLVMNQPRITVPGVGHRPVMPPRPPVTTTSSLIAVNEKPLASSSLGPRETFVFHADSAGLGIPRGSLGKLQGFSNGVQKHGTVETPVYSAPLGARAQNDVRGAQNDVRGAKTGGVEPSGGMRTISRSPGPGSPGTSSRSGGSSAGGAGGGSAGGMGGMSASGASTAGMGASGMSHGGASAPSGGHR